MEWLRIFTCLFIIAGAYGGLLDKLTSDSVSGIMSKTLKSVNDIIKDQEASIIPIPKFKKRVDIEVEFITHELQILGLGTLYGLGPVSMTGCLVTKSNSTTSLVECGLEMSHVTSDVNLEVEITSPYFESTFSMSLEYPRVEIGLDFWVSSAGDVTIKSLDLDKRPKVLSKTKRVPSILKVFIPRLVGYLDVHVERFLQKIIVTYDKDIQAILDNQVKSLMK